MAGGTGLSSFISGFGMGQQALDSGANLELRRDAMRMEREKYRREVEREEGRKRALGLYTASLNEKGESDFDNPEFLNRMLQNPAMSKAIAASFTEDSPAGEKGYTRVPVALEPAVRQAGTDANGQPVFEKIPGKYAVRVQWRDADGKVVSEGPATENGTNDPNDRVVEVDAKTAAQALFSEIGAYAPELLPQITAQRERKRDLSALQTLSTLKPIADGGPAPVQAPGQPAGAAPRTAPRAPAPSAQAAAPAEQTPAAAPVEQTPAGTPADKARFVRLRDKMNNELKAAGDELAAVMAPASDANHQGARQADYEQRVKAGQEKIAALSAKYQDLHKRFGVPIEGAVPETVAPDQAPVATVEPERVKVAATVPPARAQSGLQSLQAATKARGAPKLNNEQKDALAWLTSRGKITVEQYDRALRTGRLGESTKKMVSDGLSGLWVQDENGNISHINGPFQGALVAAKAGKSNKDGIELADKQARFIKEHYGFLAMRPGAKGGADVLDSNRFNTVRDNLLVSAASLGFDPYTPQSVTMINKAKQLQDAWVRANGPAWTNLWLKDEKRFNSNTPGIIAEKFGKDMSTVMDRYYAPLRALLGKNADQVSGQVMDGFALVVAGLEARGVDYNEAVKAATLVVQQGYTGAFSDPQRMIELALQDGK